MKNIQTAAVCAVLCLLPQLTQAQQITRQQMPPQPPQLTAYGVSHPAGMDLDGNYYRISAENLELLFSRIEQELQNSLANPGFVFDGCLGLGFCMPEIFFLKRPLGLFRHNAGARGRVSPDYGGC